MVVVLSARQDPLDSREVVADGDPLDQPMLDQKLEHSPVTITSNDVTLAGING
jgi:hypothetical protein